MMTPYTAIVSKDLMAINNTTHIKSNKDNGKQFRYMIWHFDTQ